MVQRCIYKRIHNGVYESSGNLCFSLSAAIHPYMSFCETVLSHADLQSDSIISYYYGVCPL